MTKRADWTFSGERPDQVVSALRKAIRRGEVDNALHWLVELILRGGRMVGLTVAGDRDL